MGCLSARDPDCIVNEYLENSVSEHETLKFFFSGGNFSPLGSCFKKGGEHEEDPVGAGYGEGSTLGG